MLWPKWVSIRTRPGFYLWFSKVTAEISIFKTPQRLEIYTRKAITRMPCPSGWTVTTKTFNPTMSLAVKQVFIFSKTFMSIIRTRQEWQKNCRGPYNRWKGDWKRASSKVCLPDKTPNRQSSWSNQRHACRPRRLYIRSHWTARHLWRKLLDS